MQVRRHEKHECSAALPLLQQFHVGERPGAFRQWVEACGSACAYRSTEHELAEMSANY
jgi:hypothetical protein